MTRIYQPIPLPLNEIIPLDPRASHYLAHVLRATCGEAVTIFNGQGGEYLTEIVQINKKGVQVLVKAHETREAESPLRLHLAQGIARGEKMDFIVQKAVELGVTQITPLVTARAQGRLTGEREAKRHAHWQSVIASACEQCGRNLLPTLAAPMAFKPWLAQAVFDHAFVLSPHVTAKLPSLSMPQRGNILLLIGPEGGLNEEEINEATQSGMRPLNLGPRILRTETATITALTVMQCRFGDMQ